MELILVRHAEPVRIEGAEGPADPPLTPRGHLQSEALAAWLLEEHLDLIVTSPLRRALETAEPLANSLGITLEVDEDLSEFDRDSPTYIPLEELKAARDPRWIALAEDRWHELAELDPEQFRRTVLGSLDRVVARNPGGRVVVVTHGGVINIYLANVLGIGRDLWFEPAYASISRVLASRSGIRTVLSVNETGHLRPLEHLDASG